LVLLERDLYLSVITGLDLNYKISYSRECWTTRRGLWHSPRMSERNV